MAHCTKNEAALAHTPASLQVLLSSITYSKSVQKRAPCWRVSRSVERDVVVTVADKRRVEKVADKQSAVNGFHGVAEARRRFAADVAKHRIKRMRHCVDCVDDEAEL